ncbi:MAG: lysophospholipid acyltransferase family protein [Candidatus Sumerlaeota bacterium]
MTEKILNKHATRSRTLQNIAVRDPYLAWEMLLFPQEDICMAHLKPKQYVRSLWRRGLMILFTCAVFARVAWARVRYRDRRTRIAAAKDHCAWGLRIGTRILGYTIRQHGRLPEGGALLTPNHTGYGDILALGGRARCLFVPKQEIGNWPVVGTIVRLTGHILVKRTAGRSMKATARSIQDRLEDGFRVCVFLEGTTTGGDRLLPFRASFLQPAIDAKAPIVPVALHWKATRPGTSVIEHVAFWRPGIHRFWTHLARHAGLNGIEVDIFYGQPIDPTGWDRKALADELEKQVRKMLELEENEKTGKARFRHLGVNG